MLTITRAAPGGATLRLVANVGPEAQLLQTAPAESHVLLDSEEPRFGGSGTTRPLAPYQLLLYELR